MMRPFSVRLVFPFALVVLLLPGCSSSSDEAADTTSAPTTTEATTTTTVLEPPTYEVATTALSDPAAKDLHVWAPDAEGSWPVVYAIPGSGGEAERDLAVLASELASRGVLVLGTDWIASSQEWGNGTAECGYRFARTVAEDFGGDLSQPVTMVGFSIGGPVAVYHTVDERQYGADWEWTPAIDGPPCFPDVTERPDVAISIAGAFTSIGFPREIQEWGNKDAPITLITGADDTNVPPTSSEAALSYLKRNDYTVTLVEIPDTDHGEHVFHDINNDWAELPPDSPGGQQTVRIILETINQALK